MTLTRPETMFREIDVYHIELGWRERGTILNLTDLDEAVRSEVKATRPTDRSPACVLSRDELVHLVGCLARGKGARIKLMVELASML